MRLKSILIYTLLVGISLPAMAQRKKKATASPRKKTEAARKAIGRNGKQAATPAAKVAEKRSASKDTVKGATIEILQSYKPELRRAPKPDINPTIPPADTARRSYTYQVPQQTLYYTYSSFPLRPLALGKDSIEVPFANYVKIGGGNLSTFLLDAGIGSLRGEDYETAVHIYHLSRSGRIDNQAAMTTGATATGTLHRYGMASTAYVDISREQYHYYGYDHNLFSYDKRAVRQRFTDFNFGLSTKNEQQQIGGLNYNPSLDFSFYGDRYEASEASVTLKAPVTYDVDTTTRLHLGINLWYTRFSQDVLGIAQNNNIFQITPGVSYHNEFIRGYAGLYPTFGKGGASYLLPDVNVNFRIPQTQVAFAVGYLAALRQNTYEQLSRRNPFMYNKNGIQQSRIDEAFAAGETNIGNHFYLQAKVSWKSFRNMPLFINDTSSGSDMKQFNIVYDGNIKAIALEGTVRYQMANTFSIGLSPALINFYTRTYAHVWHEPAIRLKGDMMIRPLKELTVTAYLSVMDELYAIDKANVSRKLDPVFDLGGAAEYNITNRLSAFAQVNNLLNNRYERWYGYETFGFNIFGGVRFKF